MPNIRKTPITVNVGVSETGDWGASGPATVTLTNSGSVSYYIDTTNDQVDEANGKVTATLQAGTGYRLASGSDAASVNVADNDAPLPVITISGGSGITEGGTASYTITSTPAPASPLTVNIGVSESGNWGVSGSTTVSVSGASTTYTVTTSDDHVDEPNGSVTATVQAGVGYTVGSPAAASVNVADNDGTTPVAEAPLVKYADLVKTFYDRITARGQHGNGPEGGWNKRFLKAMGHPEYVNYPQPAATVQDARDRWNSGGPGANTAWDGTVEALQYKLAYDAGTVTTVNPPPPPPTPVITISGGAGITEGGTASFTISANPAPTSPLTVNIGVTESGSFGATGASTVSVSSASTTYPITTSNDNVDEPNGSVTATIQSGTGYTVGAASSASVSVADNDDAPPPPTVVPEITISGGSGITEGGTATFTLSASPAPSSPITVNIGVTESGNFGASGSATVSVSGASTTYTVTTSDDHVDEPNGSVTATVQSGSGYTVGTTSTASVSVADNDDAPPPPTVVPEITISGGASIPEGGATTFTISATPAPTSPLTVNLLLSQTGGYGATGAASVSVSGTSVSYPVSVPDNTLDQADGSVTVTVQSGTGYTVGGMSSRTVTITDNDVPEITISGGAGIIEGETAPFTLSANPEPASPLTVNIEVSEDGDFEASGTATVEVSAAATPFTIATTDDDVDEPDGSVTVTVQSGTGYTVGTDSAATVPVADDDDPAVGNSGTLTVSIADVAETAYPGDFLRFTISLSEAAEQQVTISYEVDALGGWLTPGLDYCLLATDTPPAAGFRCMNLPAGHDNEGGAVVLAKGEDEATIFVWIAWDALASGNPFVTVRLTEVEGAKAITKASATGRVDE